MKSGMRKVELSKEDAKDRVKLKCRTKVADKAKVKKKIILTNLILHKLNSDQFM